MCRGSSAETFLQSKLDFLTALSIPKATINLSQIYSYSYNLERDQIKTLSQKILIPSGFVPRASSADLYCSQERSEEIEDEKSIAPSKAYLWLRKSRGRRGLLVNLAPEELNCRADNEPKHNRHTVHAVYIKNNLRIHLFSEIIIYTCFSYCSFYLTGCSIFSSLPASDPSRGPHFTGCRSREQETFRCWWSTGTFQNLTEPGALRVFYQTKK